MKIELDPDEARAALLAIARNPSWHDAMDRAADKIKAALNSPPEQRSPAEIEPTHRCPYCGSFDVWQDTTIDAQTNPNTAVTREPACAGMDFQARICCDSCGEDDDDGQGAADWQLNDDGYNEVEHGLAAHHARKNGAEWWSANDQQRRTCIKRWIAAGRPTK